MFASKRPRGSPRSCWNTHPARHIERNGSPKSGTESMCRTCGKSNTAQTTHRPPAVARLLRHVITPRDVVCRRAVQPIDTTAPVSPGAREEWDARRKRQTHHCQNQRDDSGTHSVPRRQADASEDDVGTAGGSDVEREARKNQDEPVQHERKPDSRSVVERHVSGFYPLRTPSARSSTRIRSSMSAAKKVSASGPVTGAWAISAMPASSPNTAT